ncbi:DUF3073 domain-containing protein [Nakamurella silvestris]|nr:DUF3073 domain-containing protein [Nakamurella silvestris]
MGRGRQKAKQTKVARELKYSTSDIDVTALQRELSTGLGTTQQRHPTGHSSVDPDEDEDEYGSYSRAR